MCENRADFEWFTSFLMDSLVWFMATPDESSQFMYEELLKIAQKYAKNVDSEFETVYKQLSADKRFSDLCAIRNEDKIKRNDDSAVGLLHNLRQINSGMLRSN